MWTQTCRIWAREGHTLCVPLASVTSQLSDNLGMDPQTPSISCRIWLWSMKSGFILGGTGQRFLWNLEPLLGRSQGYTGLPCAFQSCRSFLDDPEARYLSICLSFLFLLGWAFELLVFACVQVSQGCCNKLFPTCLEITDIIGSILTLLEPRSRSVSLDWNQAINRVFLLHELWRRFWCSLRFWWLQYSFTSGHITPIPISVTILPPLLPVSSLPLSLSY